MPIYFDNFAEADWNNVPAGWPRVQEDFGIKREEPEVLFASYTYEYYEGDALVVFREDGKLYEVSGSHCSCYGLEDQWEPEETTVETLRARLLAAGRYGIWKDRATELHEVITRLESEAKGIAPTAEQERAKVVEFLRDLDPILAYAIETGEHWK